MSITALQNSTCLLLLGFFFYIYTYMSKLTISIVKTSQGASMSELMRFDHNFLKLPRIEHMGTASSWLKDSHTICVYIRRKNRFSERITSLQRFKQKYKETTQELSLTSRKIYGNNCITTSLQSLLFATLKRHAGKNKTGCSWTGFG